MFSNHSATVKRLLSKSLSEPISAALCVYKLKFHLADQKNFAS